MIESENFNIDFKSLENLSTFVPMYHKENDTFFIRPEQPLPAVSFDWNGELWIRVDSTGKIVGLEVENFESVFLKKHPEVAQVWTEAKRFCLHRKVRTNEEDICESFIRIMLQFLSNMFQNNPQQVSFSTI